MTTPVICSVDLGSTNIKAGCVDENGAIVALASRPIDDTLLDSEGVVFDAKRYFQATLKAVRACMDNTGPASRVVGVVITSQRATIVPIDHVGEAIGPALSWQDTRGEAPLRRLLDELSPDRFNQITGLLPSPIWSIAKLLWLREHLPDVWRDAARFVLLHDFVVRLLGADTEVTDPSNASLTGFFDLHEGAWSTELLHLMKLPPSRLPRVLPAGSTAGHLNQQTAEATGLTAGIPLLVGGGDQQCAVLGAGVVRSGESSVCLGTAAAVMSPVRQEQLRRARAHGVACTAHVVAGWVLLEGLHASFGSSLGRVAELLGASAGELIDLASRSSCGARGLVFLPFLAGIASPDFDECARGALLGLHLKHQRADLARAAYEGNCLELRRIFEAISACAQISSVALAGGRGRSSWTSQLLADLTGLALQVREVPEATLLGAAILGWQGVGEFSSAEEGVRRFQSPVSETFTPTLPADQRDRLFERYKNAVGTIRAHPIDSWT